VCVKENSAFIQFFYFTLDIGRWMWYNKLND
jgi:hypothetical protein